MKNNYILIVLFILQTFITSCQDNLKQKELDIKERELILKEKELAKIEKENSKDLDTAIVEPISQNLSTASNVQTTKFGFVIFECQIPQLKELYDDDYIITLSTTNFGSKVVEISNYSTDEEYKLLDKGESEMDQKLNAFKSQLHGEIIMKVRPYEKGDDLLKVAETKYKILDREAKIYSTYSEASIARKNMGF